MLKQNARSMSITSQESYSAVMITDLVADVPISTEPEQISAKTTKEETNLAYDAHLDGESKTTTIDGIDSTNSHITNGGSISRGVILNAVQFGQSDSKTKIDEKGIQLTASLPIPPLPQQISESKGFKDMSILRKIAFGFSFLPSVLFVLCFAIILPCNVPKPCVEELWFKTFENTEAISKLEISQNVMFTAALDQQKNVLMELHRESGHKEKIISLDAKSPYLKCGHFLNAEKTDCIILDEEGKFYTLNNTHSNLLWNISEGEQPSPPVILSDCNRDKVEEIAMAVSSTKIKIMYGGSTHSSLTISSLCDSIPTKVMPWTTNGTSDIVFACKKNTKDRIVKIPNSLWCAYSENPRKNASILYEGVLDSLKNAIIQTTENGLVLWSGDEVLMRQSDGSPLWKEVNEIHSEENRYIFHGKFKENNQQIVLLSSSASSGIKVSFLNVSNGNLLKSSSFNDSEVIDVQVVKGENKDTILIFHEVKRPTDILTSALSQINDISTTITNLISNNETNSATVHRISQEISFLDQEGKLVTVKDIGPLDAVYRTTMKAIYEETTDTLRIYLLSTSESNAPEKNTNVRNINVANWNKSKKSRCLGNVLQH